MWIWRNKRLWSSVDFDCSIWLQLLLRPRRRRCAPRPRLAMGLAMMIMSHTRRDLQPDSLARGRQELPIKLQNPWSQARRGRPGQSQLGESVRRWRLMEMNSSQLQVEVPNLICGPALVPLHLRLVPPSHLSPLKTTTFPLAPLIHPNPGHTHQ